MALFRREHGALCRYLLRFAGDEDLAADAAQDAFVRLLERPPTPGAERTWLFRVATNAAIDAVRMRARRASLRLEAGGRLPHGDPPAAPDRGVEEEERKRAVHAALAGLSEKERAALLMREEGFRHEEIARALGTTTKSVGTLLGRALRKAAALLEPERERL